MVCGWVVNNFLVPLPSATPQVYRMRPASASWCLVAVLMTMTPLAQATLSLAVLPAVASVGGLAALKVLKYVGLSKLRKTITNSGLSSITDLDDSGNDYYDQQPPIFVAPPPTIIAPSPTYYAQPPSYYPPSFTPLPLSSPPAFYIVPASSLENFRTRRDVSSISGSGTAAGQVAVRSEREYFDMISGLDRDGCVLRAVCEVASEPVHLLTEDEKAIMAAFSSPYKPSRQGPTTWRDIYYQAVWVGKTANDAAITCAKTYTRCPLPARELLKTLHEEEEQQKEGEASRQ
ncbi:uncharacterized protein LOC123502376 [Portunus trituberculatus]|uniref:uncharacterized protein LOC123502376 n=1 Tax=Portunus trituberculatus TaxID=210409 RepID=UPI001E1CE1A5|nr:uncharacterized protein LOC123502376 [Portunus trituberculatus]